MKEDDFIPVRDSAMWPLQAVNKKKIYNGVQYVDDEEMKKDEVEVWNRLVNCEIKVIDFGGATYQGDHKSSIINTRQYRAPEVILSKRVM